MPTEAPPDLGTGAGGLMQIGQTQVVGQSGTAGATLPVDALQQASSMIVQGKADLNQTAGAEHRLDGFDGVGGGGGGGGGDTTATAAPTDQNVGSGGLGGQQAVGASGSSTTPNAMTASDTSGSSDTTGSSSSGSGSSSTGTGATSASDTNIPQFDTGSPGVPQSA
jgi:hypothetical protein